MTQKPGTLPPLQADTVLQARYRVTGIVGGGGMALVYRVEETHPRPGQIWALKELRPASSSSEEQADARRQFSQEAGLLARLDHPHLPKVVDYFDESGRSYLVMEFIEGQSLEKHLEAAGRPLPEKPVLHWMIQVCQVLDYLHGQEPPIIFRDLKPSNIMLCNTGAIKLIDFGIARTYKVGKKKDTVAMGSENYAPPEQWGREQTDARSDIYALGATMYHLLAGSPPPLSCLPGPLSPPRSINPLVSPPSEQVILKAMAKDRGDRYPTAKEMAAALAGCLASLAVPTTVQPVPAIRERPCPSCTRPIRQGARFCGYCGAHLGGPLQGVLQVLGSSGTGWEMPLSKIPFLIGRKSVVDGIHPDLDLSYYDTRFVSRCHAQISQQGGEYVLIDLGSANGTFVNGTRLSPHTPQVLRSGDRIIIGRVHLMFRLIV
ncbi:MAG: protein kinase [Anaerolineae bacterium]|nr:protein kinase [Anaerolineae bacterium]